MDDFRNETCGKCKYFRDGAGFGLCLRYPPTSNAAKHSRFPEIPSITLACGEFVRIPLEVRKKDDFDTGIQQKTEQKKATQPVAESEPTAAEIRIILILERNELYQSFLGRNLGEGASLDILSLGLRMTTSEIMRAVTDSRFLSVTHRERKPDQTLINGYFGIAWVSISKDGLKWLIDRRDGELQKLLADA